MANTQTEPESGNFLRKVAEIVKNPRVIVPTAIAVAGATYLVGQNNQREHTLEAVSQERQVDQAYYDFIETLSEKPAIISTADVVFEVNGPRLYDQTLEELSTVPEFAEDYKENRDVIDSTLLTSTKALGVYHEGDDIAVTRLKIDDTGNAVYITQFVTEESQQLGADEWIKRLSGEDTPNATPGDPTPPPIASELPTVETH